MGPRRSNGGIQPVGRALSLLIPVEKHSCETDSRLSFRKGGGRDRAGELARADSCTSPLVGRRDRSGQY